MNCAMFKNMYFIYTPCLNAYTIFIYIYTIYIFLFPKCKEFIVPFVEFCIERNLIKHFRHLLRAHNILQVIL